MPTEGTKTSLADARALVIVVHGVGDHSPENIIGDAKVGYESMGGLVADAHPVVIEGLLDADGARPPRDALEIVAGGAKHVIIPYVWSRPWERSAARAALMLPGFDLSRILLPLYGVLFGLVADILKCVPKARGTAWKCALVLLALLTLVLVLAVILGIVVLAAALWFWFGTGGGLPAGQYGYAVVVIVVLVIVWVLRKSVFPVFDFVADVARYIARPRRRAELESRLADIIADVAGRAPDARIVVVGHSLGSVLVSHCLHDRAPEAARGRLLMVTLGSPLRLLSRVFPDHISSPEELAAAYQGSEAVGFWANAWRDEDVIGRDLGPVAWDRFAEKSLGEGPHWGMWKSAELWRGVAALLDAAAEDPPDAARAWPATPWGANEETETRARYARIAFHLTALMAAMMFTLTDTWRDWTTPAAPEFGEPSATIRVVLQVLILAAAVPEFLIVLVFGMRPTRGYLATLRLTRHWAALIANRLVVWLALALVGVALAF